MTEQELSDALDRMIDQTFVMEQNLLHAKRGLDEIERSIHDNTPEPSIVPGMLAAILFTLLIADVFVFILWLAT